jgi:hypothetical protein
MVVAAAGCEWNVPPPGCWPTELQAARLRLTLGMLLHTRLGSDAHRRVFTRDADVLASIGARVVGRPPLVFDRVPSPGADVGGCDGIVRGDNAGRGTAVCSDVRLRSGVHYAEFTLLAGDPRGIRMGIVQANYVPRRGHWATDSHWDGDGRSHWDGDGRLVQGEADDGRLRRTTFAPEVDVAQSAGWCFDPSAGQRPTRVRALLARRPTHTPFAGAPGHLAQDFVGEECALGDRVGIQLVFCGEHTQHDDDVQVELTIFRNGDELGVLLLRDIPLDGGLCWAAQYSSGADAVRIRAVDPTHQSEHHRWAWSVHWIAAMGNDWIRTLSTSPMDFDARGGSADIGLHLVERYPAIDISLLWPPDLVANAAWQEQQQQKQEEQEQQQRRTVPGWLLLRTLLLVASGAAWSRMLADGSLLAVLQNQVSYMLAILLPADVRGADD